MFTLILYCCILYGSIQTLYNVMAYEVFKIGPSYVSDSRCYNITTESPILYKDSNSVYPALPQAVEVPNYNNDLTLTPEGKACVEKAYQKAQAKLERNTHISYSKAISTLIVATIMLLIVRREDK